MNPFILRALYRLFSDCKKMTCTIINYDIGSNLRLQSVLDFNLAILLRSLTHDSKRTETDLLATVSLLIK